jgi:thymidylate kinase
MKCIAITGPDGAGKSTLCKRLNVDLESRGFKTAISSAWDSLIILNKYSNGGFQDKEQVQNYLMSCEGESRIYFMLHSLMRSLEEHRRDGVDLLILDGYWYKYIVSEISFGIEKSELKNLCNLFPDVLSTIFLDIKPKLALSRKKELSQYETQGSKKAANFLELQRNQYSLWQDLLKSNPNWKIISSDQEVDSVYEQLLEAVNSLDLR